MKRRALLVLVVAQLLVTSPTIAADRDASLINSFQVLCTLEKPDFERIDQKATAMKLPVHQDLRAPISGTMFSRSKSWVVTLTTGNHELVATEANGPRGHIVSCGISAIDPNGDTFKNEVIAAMKLGEPSTQVVSPDGSMRMTIWKNAFGEGTTLRFVDASPRSAPGAFLAYDVEEPPKR